MLVTVMSGCVRRDVDLLSNELTTESAAPDEEVDETAPRLAMARCLPLELHGVDRLDTLTSPPTPLSMDLT